MKHENDSPVFVTGMIVCKFSISSAISSEKRMRIAFNFFSPFERDAINIYIYIYAADVRSLRD